MTTGTAFGPQGYQSSTTLPDGTERNRAGFGVDTWCQDCAAGAENGTILYMSDNVVGVQKSTQWDGIYDISDSFEAGKDELQLKVRPSAEAVGVTMPDLARQVRQGFYGEEAQRIHRGRDDVKVMVRYPETERRSLSG